MEKQFNSYRDGTDKSGEEGLNRYAFISPQKCKTKGLLNALHSHKHLKNIIYMEYLIRQTYVDANWAQTNYVFS